MSNLDKIKLWMEVNAPSVLSHLNGPASDAEIDNLEVQLGVSLPNDYREFLTFHNGESGDTTFFGDGNELLSCEYISEQYMNEREQCEISYDDFVQHSEWKRLVLEELINIKGPVKPHHSHSSWIPITNMNGDVTRYIDLDPAISGISGQIIEVDWPSSWEVLASSFSEYLGKYHSELIAGRYEVDECGDITTKEEYLDEDQLWGVPDWLIGISDSNVLPLEYNDTDWHLDLRNFSVVRELLDSTFPKEIELNEWQDFEPSKIDSEYFEITWIDEKGGLFIAFAHASVFSGIALKIEKKSKRMSRVRLRVILEKHDVLTDRKSHPSWRCWLEGTKVELL